MDFSDLFFCCSNCLVSFLSYSLSVSERLGQFRIGSRHLRTGVFRRGLEVSLGFCQVSLYSFEIPFCLVSHCLQLLLPVSFDLVNRSLMLCHQLSHGSIILVYFSLQLLDFVEILLDLICLGFLQSLEILLGLFLDRGDLSFERCDLSSH